MMKTFAHRPMSNRWMRIATLVFGLSLLALMVSGCGGVDGKYVQRIVTFSATWDSGGAFAGMQLDTDDGQTCNVDSCRFADIQHDDFGSASRDAIELSTRENEDPYRILLRNDDASSREYRVRVYFGTLSTGDLQFDQSVVVPADSIFEVLIYRNGDLQTVFTPRKSSRSAAPLPANLGWKKLSI
jgi:hypothetical protein